MPNRILKESICTSEDVEAMDMFTEVFFYRLLVNCDDYGRMDARPAILRAKLFPLREVEPAEMERALARLVQLGCVRRYAVRGQPYIWVPAWGAHQRVRTVRAKYPGPDDAEDGGLPQAAADGGGLRPESNPNQSETESEAESEAEGQAGAAGLEAVAAAAAAMGMPFLKKDREIAGALAQAYTEPWVLEAMARAADGPSRTWRYVRGILKRWQEKGGIDDAGGGVRASPGGKRVNAQMYTQREYTREELDGLFEIV